MPTKIPGIYEFIQQMARHNATKVLPLTNETKLTLTVTLTLTNTVTLTLTLLNLNIYVHFIDTH